MYRAFLLSLSRALSLRKTGIPLAALLIVGFSPFSCAAAGIPLSNKFSKFEQIYEPSGVQQLPDGRLIVVEDESDQPVDVIMLQSDGRVSEQALYSNSLFSLISPNRALSTLKDLEAVAVDGQSRIYVITSHSRKKNGKRPDNREQLVRFALEGERAVDIQVVRGLRKKIFQQHTSLEHASYTSDVEDERGFNIEGLSFDATKQKLLIGLRSPLAGDNAIIVVLENPLAVFDHNEAPRISEALKELDLGGGGIRALSYDQHLGGYLIVSRKSGKKFKLWLWSGDNNESPQRLQVPDVKNLSQAEGVTPVRLDDGQTGILIVSDDGNGVKGKPGHYLFLHYEQLLSR
ncbi:MAG: hypothetical protein ACI8ZB_000515 [Desulforhopalus sp.]|jgi:hypothetical protein